MNRFPRCIWSIVALTAAFAGGLAACWAMAQQPPAVERPAEPWQQLVGSWMVTSGQKSLVISLEPDRKALVIFMQPGQFSINRVGWEPLPGGVLINDRPRKRLWLGRHDQELRAEIEPVPEAGYDPDKEFHKSFFMRRVSDAELPPAWSDRPIPTHWQQGTLADDWDQQAGRRASQ